MQGDDTIAAIATPPGTSGLAVLRLSGPDAIECAARCFAPAEALRGAASHTLHHGTVRDADGALIDEVVAAVFRAPRSYTGEHVVELSCHGGLAAPPAVLRRLLDAGARHAAPGEFTRRAFLNGTLDLAQAEAVADLIHARTEEARALSARQLEGALSDFVSDVRERILHAAAMLELSLDFAEEDVRLLTPAELDQLLGAAADSMDTLLRSHGAGRVLRDGARVVLAGAPNAGKSSLLNALLGTDRAIVTPEPGTTRDWIEEQAVVDGALLRLVDTAGLRDADDRVEHLGVARTRDQLGEADIVLHVLDASAPTFTDAAERAPANAVVVTVWNKSDLVASDDLPDGALAVSARTGAGLSALRSALAARAAALARPATAGLRAVANARHADCLRRALESVAAARDALAQGMTEEFAAADLRRAADALGDITGAVAREDVLDAIFSRFCIGK